MLEKAIISGVAHTFDEAVYRVRSVDRADLFAALADAGVNVDTIIRPVTRSSSRRRFPTAARLRPRSTEPRPTASAIEGLAKVSLIGAA